MKVGEIHCGGKWKSVHIWSFSGPHFPALGLQTERNEVSPYLVWMREYMDQKISECENIAPS